ncbi:MAG: hypothetical protein ED559_02635 [Phycisphaera sp.]|nr:MAG: hypothetical protein ED559_02635 [Phycisphaera sp.]
MARACFGGFGGGCFLLGCEEFGGGFACGLGVGAGDVGEVAEGGDRCGAGFGLFESAAGFGDLLDGGEYGLGLGGGEDGCDLGDAQVHVCRDIDDGVDGVLERFEERVELIGCGRGLHVPRFSCGGWLGGGAIVWRGLGLGKGCGWRGGSLRTHVALPACKLCERDQSQSPGNPNLPPLLGTSIVILIFTNTSKSSYSSFERI